MVRRQRYASLVCVHYITACVLLFSVLLRATIPVGFMPTSSAKSGFLSGLSLCATGLSAQAIQFFQLHSDSDSHDAHATLDCAFASVLTKPAVLGHQNLAIKWVLGASWQLHYAFFVFPWQLGRYGPPLGARAPPR